MAGRIAVGVDGSPQSVAAAHWAAQEAVRRGAELVVAHAWVTDVRSSPAATRDSTERGWAERVLREAVGSVRAAHPTLAVTGRLIAESPVPALLSVAAEADTLVVGTLGLGRAAGVLVGSVSLRVAGRAPCPVVLVRAGRGAADEHLPASPGLAPDEIPSIPYRAVVLGLDVGSACDQPIGFAFEAARRRCTELRVCHVREPDEGTGAEGAAAAEHAVIALLRPWHEKYPDVSVATTVTEGRAGDELVRATDGAGLVVVGRRISGSRLGERLGHVAHAVVQHAECPVAIVPHN
ncbi:universal stress protein [Streptomyces malaysiense]|uniref:Universal stress family protein n=1 Tax=Streptomyces malaysiense TaxID=1428626 RepID=A0A1J4Q4X7_9ACTN|nr:universal stress protein [Streptomyces malaysiense]OIK28243.1 universal stress family protein [Streptomyces malaysiense]